MTTRHDPPPERQPVRGIVFGDAEAPAPAAVPAPVSGAGPVPLHPAAALLPDDLRLVFEGANRYRLPFLTASVGVIALVAFAGFQQQDFGSNPFR